MSITTNVIRYCVSAIANVSRGGTKKKSSDATPTSAASTDGPRPQVAAVSTTPSRYTIARFATSMRRNMSQAMPVHTAMIITAMPYADEGEVGRSLGTGAREIGSSSGSPWMTYTSMSPLCRMRSLTSEPNRSSRHLGAGVLPIAILLTLRERA